MMQSIEEWKRKLVDLSRRNRLLYFRPGRSSTLKINGPEPEQVFERFVLKEHKQHFWVQTPEKSIASPKALVGIEKEQDGKKEVQFLSPERIFVEISVSSSCKMDELVCNIRDPAEFVRILKNLHRRSRTDFEERGVRILHLAFGMLNWQEIENSEPIRSPLLLVPAELVRESAHQPFELRPIEEDAVLNPALDVKLSKDFKIELPPIPENFEETSLLKYLDKINKSVKRRGWSVDLETWLGLFSFNKLVIYRDLSANGQIINTHPVIRGLAGEKKNNDLDMGISDGPELKTEELHLWHDPKASFLIVDADSSQLACIEGVKRGADFVLHGPPGTGKSQTITNVIAEFIALGKTVLFVSEKMAALEVVFKRLREAHLNHFCLEVHSHRSNKRDVVQELYRSLNERLEPKKVLSAYELKTLLRRRQQLGDYVHALHVKHKSLERSTFEVLAELSELHSVPLIAFECTDIMTLNPGKMARINETASRLQTIWRIAQEGPAFPWRGCKAITYTAVTKTNYQQVLEKCLDSIGRLRESSKSAEEIGVLPAPDSFQDCYWLAGTLRLLTENLCPVPSWFTTPVLDQIILEAKALQKLTQTYQNMRKNLLTHHGRAFLNLSSSLREQVEKAYQDTAALLLLNPKEDNTLLIKARTIVNWAEDFCNRISEWESKGMEILQCLGLPAKDLTIKRLADLVRLVDLCGVEDKPDFKWLNGQSHRKVTEEIPRIRAAYYSYCSTREKLLKSYNENVFELDLDRLIEELSGRYKTAFRWALPSFYRDRKAIARCHLDYKLPATVRDDLILARDAKKLKIALDNEALYVHGLVGAYYRGYDTDFERIERALAFAREAMNLAGCNPLPEKLLSQLSLDGLISVEAKDAAFCLRNSLTESQAFAKQLIGLVMSEMRLPSVSFPLDLTPLQRLREWVESLAKESKHLAELLEKISRATLRGLPDTLNDLLSDLDMVLKLNELCTIFEKENARLKEVYGEHFCGMETNWVNVLAGLDWVARVRRHFGDREMSQKFIAKVTNNPSQRLNSEVFDNLLQQFQENFKNFEALFEGTLNIDDLPLRLHPFPQIASHLTSMINRLDEIRDWVDFQSIRRDLKDMGLSDLFIQLQALLPEKEIIPQVVQRAVFHKWVEYVFEQEPALAVFRSQDHENLILEFRELDRLHWMVGSHRVIAEANKNKLQAEYIPGGSEIGLLKHEALKQRRHLPIRKLFEKMPLLISRLKPCLLMSPLSVSQFLGPEMKFDLVIFDEASQICTEDAVGAIYRGAKLLVCGDNKQLPPTSFFQSGMSEEYDEEHLEDGEEFEPLESVLDDCIAMNMHEGFLKWHYRSRHESLITFSNNNFYDNRLVTFPSCFKDHEDLGIKFVYVENGVYDRGGKRNNLPEARVVADLIFKHFQQHETNKSLGVIAFSQAQMETILDELELRLKENQEMERYFKGDRIDEFFVKNLENVQGDERDVIIFSVGYGKDRTGRMTMNFGPLNQPGGQRRLNVAVTRAREKVVLVSSIRSVDIDLGATQADGVRMLHRYLDYAERGESALAFSTAPGGDFESPLERDVAQVIRNIGYNVVPQVGCSGFRIDLGIVDPAMPGRFLLGVECDGASYHSSYAARDKDRLRQEVLEHLGWRIHRIWSPDWVNRRDTEIERLRAVIGEAGKAAFVETSCNIIPNNSQETGENIPSPGVKVEENNHEKNSPNELSCTEPYEVYRFSLQPGTEVPFHLPQCRSEQAILVEKIVEREGPVHVKLVAHRMAQGWGLTKVGKRIQGAVDEAIRLAINKGQIKKVKDFLWPTDPDFETKLRVPVEGDPETLRQVEEISQTEIGLAMCYIVEAGMSISPDALFSEVTRVFGFMQVGNRIRKHLTHILAQLIKKGVFAKQNDSIRLLE